MSQPPMSHLTTGFTGFATFNPGSPVGATTLLHAGAAVQVGLDLPPRSAAEARPILILIFGR
jgi:hypothetical protein